jgi:hypothetical protein
VVKEKYYLDMLTEESVSVRKQRLVELDGTEYPVGEPWRRAYINSQTGRAAVEAELPEPYRSAIFAVWGDEPTVADPVDESPTEEDAGSAE